MATGAIIGQSTSNLLPLDGSKSMSGNLNMGSNKITNVVNGSNTKDAVNYGQLTTSSVSASRITGTLSVSHGGTGLSSIPDNQIIYGNASSSLSSLNFPSNNNSILTQNTSNAPYWSTLKNFFNTYNANISYSANSNSFTYSNGNILADSIVFVSLAPTNSSTYKIISSMNIFVQSQSSGSIVFGVNNPYNQSITIPLSVVLVR